MGYIYRVFRQHRRLTYRGQVTHICVGKLTITGSDNGLSPGRRQAMSPGRRQTIIWANVGILLIGPLGTNFSEIQIGVQTFIEENALENVVCEMAFILSRPQGVNIASTSVTCGREMLIKSQRSNFHVCKLANQPPAGRRAHSGLLCIQHFAYNTGTT